MLPHQQIFNHLPHFLKFVIIQLSSLVILNTVKDIPKQYLIFLLSCKQITRSKPNIWAPGIGRFYLTGNFWVCLGLCWVLCLWYGNDFSFLCKLNTFWQERLCTWPQFESEGFGNNTRKKMENHLTVNPPKCCSLLQEVPTVKHWPGKFWCFGLVVAYERWLHMEVELFNISTRSKMTSRGNIDCNLKTKPMPGG